MAAAAVVVVVSARPEAGGWNDGSRLASVECLVDYGTWVIDDSIFVDPARVAPGAAAPYTSTPPALLTRGTQDKLRINGHFYSDKSPVPALFMAGVYQALQWTTGLVARENPERFCYLLTLCSSGLAYIIAICSIHRLAAGLTTAARLLLTSSLGLATVALPYARQVNNHILLLAICSALLLVIAGRKRWQPIVIGTLVGAGYTIDLGIRPVLAASTTALVAYRTRSVRAVAWMLLAMLPWVALHHYLNYRIGGTFAPANAQAAYLLWPDSPFNAANITGRWAHASVAHFVLYALDLLFGKRGFFGHNLALFLAATGAMILIRRRVVELPEVIWASSVFVVGWLLYAATSHNHSGVCCSIRWFVPLLAPAYYILIALLRHEPCRQTELLILTLFGSVAGASMWWKGPWMDRMVPDFWFIQAGAVLCWLVYRHSARASSQRASAANSDLDQPHLSGGSRK